MMEYLKKFLSRKFNIVLAINLILALVFLAFCNIWSDAIIISMVLLGVYLIMLGVNNFLRNKEIIKNQEILEKLPFSETQIENSKKQDRKKIKSNKFQGVLYILFGIVLIFTLIVWFAI